ncbi:winged helix-turn-helix domain-containing protein [uncultured Methanobrevibacter sp.]|uniref:winged helix-turn-helix domain-containing protein n=1 Tax=uncultured Methanobrevibacter sp. TaxID=253161 RepID=UPI0026183B09|nr:winged helix-turn-helix domain-containing protein [uncultured Methanobrevibacter sp.]
MNNDEIFELVGYIMASDYRTRILKCIGNDIKVPSAIAEEIDLRTNHVSNVLKDLKDRNLVVCLNENARKGRLYKTTDLGLEILKYLH